MKDAAPVVDLARERRIRAAVDDLRAMLDADPDLAARTQAMLGGDLACPDLEDPMPRDLVNDAAVNLRLPATMLDRVEALRLALVERDPMMRAVGNVTQAAVLRLALDRGLASLAAEFLPGEDPPAG